MRIVIEILAAVLNSLWQSALVAGLVWLVLRLLKAGSLHKINAATRYAVWWGVLAVTVALPVAPPAIAWWHARARPAVEAGPRVTVARPVTAPLIEEQTAIVTLREERAARWPVWVLAGWAAVCLYRLLQIGRSYFYLRGVKRRAISSEAALPPIERRARLLLSSDVASPMAVGFLHPAVILPEALPAELAQPEMEHVLLHETAHIARKDDWTNLLARVLGAALALHPVAWWILRQIEREREIACDDWVVARTGSARPYAQSLARMSELRSKRGVVEGEALASGILGGGSRLGERIEMLLERDRVFSPRASRSRVVASAAALLGFVVAASLAPRLIAFAQAKPAFEVASIRTASPQAEGHMSTRLSIDSARVVYQNASLNDVIQQAYGVQDDQITGPDWLKSDRFIITAKIPDGTSKDLVPQMFQSLLEERFKLALHRDTRELPLYVLTIGKNGTKLKKAEAGTGISSQSDRAHWRVSARTSLNQLAGFLSQRLHRPVLDKTGLDGFFEIALEWTPDDAPSTDASSGPSLFTAVQEQLGLKLESTKGPVEVLVIDHAEKPSAN